MPPSAGSEISGFSEDLWSWTIFKNNCGSKLPRKIILVSWLVTDFLSWPAPSTALKVWDFSFFNQTVVVLWESFQQILCLILHHRPFHTCCNGIVFVIRIFVTVFPVSSISYGNYMFAFKLNKFLEENKCFHPLKWAVLDVQVRQIVFLIKLLALTNFCKKPTTKIMNWGLFNFQASESLRAERSILIIFKLDLRLNKTA